MNMTTRDGKVFARNIMEEKNSWPISEDPKSDIKYRQIVQKYSLLGYKASILMMEMLANGLGLDRHLFSSMLGPRHLSTMRLLHYPSRLHNPQSIPEEAWDGNKAIVTGEHFDSGILTLLATFENSGLQIKPHGFPHWIDVPAIKNHLIINIGNLLSDIVENKLVATNHRVLDIGVDRYSAPFFLEPEYDADVSKTIFGNTVKSLGKFKRYGPYMANRTRMFAETATIDWGHFD
jgi:Isopenicillin N synthase and related dioxygenases